MRRLPYRPLSHFPSRPHDYVLKELTVTAVNEVSPLLAMDEPVLDYDEDDDCLPEAAKPASTLTERRRAQNAIFESWLTSETGQRKIYSKVREARRHDAVTDEERSIESLMSNAGSHIINTPRQYQLDLFERAKKENTIAVLDTGSGKTMIAVLLLRWILDQELENRAARKPHRISFFLVASVTLVYQQFEVLKANIDHPMARVCGADNTEHWQKLKWQRLFSENKVIVCTAAILHQCLAHGFISMEQVNLLIFDEAHHAKKNHAYARIIGDFYLPESGSNTRPRIFGMTASPIDAKVDIAKAASDLETLLDSRIATTAHKSLTEAVKKPTESIIYYTSTQQAIETKLLHVLRTEFSHVDVLKRIVDTAPNIGQHLGSWCADRYILDATSDTKQRHLENKIERKFHARSIQKDVAILDEMQAQLQAAFEFIRKERPNMAADVLASDVSPKVLKLENHLRAHFERPTSQRCIVFVEERDTAALLAALFQKIGTQYMKAGFLIGANGADRETYNSTYRQQVYTLSRFRQGHMNCLFSTSVAEEGLDVPNCNLVIRFDLYKTVIQYVQSRGRARQSNSKFFHMVDQDSSAQKAIVSQSRGGENMMRDFCLSLPADRLLVGNEDCTREFLARKRGPVFVHPVSGARLMYHNAQEYLAHFVSMVPNENGEPQHPKYTVLPRGSKFIAEVYLPAKSPFRSIAGRECQRKSVASQSAAFEACLQLTRERHMDEHFLPTYQKKLPALRNALLAVNMHKANMYGVRTKPSIWETARGTLPTELWVTVVDFSSGLERHHQPLGLLTRSRIPDIPTFPVFLDDGQETKVMSWQVQAALKVDNEKLNKLSVFTFRIFEDVFSKTYEDDPTKLSYWIAPIALPVTPDANVHADAMVDWLVLDKVFESVFESAWTPSMPQEMFLDKFLVDRWNGGRKFYSITIEPDLKPLDTLPEHTAKSSTDWTENILGYSVSLWKKARARATWNLDQPVVKAERVWARRNMLASPDSEEKSRETQAFICPEPFRISALPPPIVASSLMWPAIIHRFESYLIAMEACDVVCVPCTPDVALAAITKDSDNSGEHDEEKINFQSGMGDNYERLEFIGDTFLKTATTISTFIQNPNDNEWGFHVKRAELLCNKNLFRVAKELKLYEYVRSTAFTRRVWYPRGIKLLKGKGMNSTDDEADQHSLSDKTLADVCEALIGAAFVTHDQPGEIWHEAQWDNAVCAVSKLVGSPDHAMTTWNDYRVAYDKPTYQIGNVTASQRDLAEKCTLEHPYQFKYPPLLRSAFTHSSQPLAYKQLPDYERLEFLGDALLDMASITHLFYRFPDKDPQWLTEHKMAMVSNRFLGAVCVNLGFYMHLRHWSSALEPQIREYATEFLEAKRLAGDSRDFWTSLSEPPKCLPDIVESYVGAMFIDSDFDYNVVQKFFDMHMKWYFEDMTLYDTYANNHPCTRLHDLLQTNYGCHDYRVMLKEIPPADGVETERKDVVAVVMVHNEIVEYTKGKSANYARPRVARYAIEAIEGLAPFEFRSKFGCDCHTKSEDDKATGG